MGASSLRASELPEFQFRFGKHSRHFGGVQAGIEDGGRRADDVSVLSAGRIGESDLPGMEEISAIAGPCGRFAGFMIVAGNASDAV